MRDLQATERSAGCPMQFRPGSGVCASKFMIAIATMKRVALILMAALLLSLSSAMALEQPPVRVDEEPALTAGKTPAILVEEDPGPPASRGSGVLVHEESEEPSPEARTAPVAHEESAPPSRQEPRSLADDESAPPLSQPPATVINQELAAPEQPTPTLSIPSQAKPPAREAPPVLVHQDPEEPANQQPLAMVEEQEQDTHGYLSEIGSDFRYAANNGEADVEDLLTAPVHIGDASSLLLEPRFYYTLIGAGAVLGGAFVLDNSVRSRIRHMGHKDASHLETLGNVFEWGATGLLYLSGLQNDDARARQTVITSIESVGIASLVAMATKAAFSRARPRDGHGASSFFGHGDSFISGAATPPFALAAGLSEYADNAWYVMIPAYSGALAVGLGRMGKDDHWLSDVIGSAIVGIGTTELMLYLHRRHAADPSRFHIFPVSASSLGSTGHQDAVQGMAPQGLGVSYEW